MKKTIFEQIGGTYTEQGDYLLPNLTLLAEEDRLIGIWAQRHARHLKQHHKILYYNLLTSCKLNSYLADVEKSAETLFNRLVKELSAKENLTEKDKAEAPVDWVKRMNNIRFRAVENVNAEIIFI